MIDLEPLAPDVNLSGVKAWLRNSAKHAAQKETAQARRCRAAYLTEPYRTAAEILARVHEQCAARWQAVLDETKDQP